MARRAEGYNGNINLKRSRVQLPWTSDMIFEYAKCKENIVYFIKKYCKIVHVDRGLIDFELWHFQEEMIRTFEANRYSIAKMPRQVGKTTTVAAYLLHKILFNENYKIALLANKDSQAREILARIQLMFEHLPKWIQQGVVEWNKSTVELENGCTIQASATGGSAVRGKSFSCVVGDTKVVICDDFGRIWNTDISKVTTLNEYETNNHYIYKTTNLINNETYIEVHSTNNVNDGFIGSGKNLKQAIEQHGISNFKTEIIKSFDIIQNHKPSCNKQQMEVLTELGFKKFDGVLKKHNPNKILFTFDCGTTLECTTDHKIKYNEDFIEAKHLNVGNIVSNKKIISRVDITNNKEVFDLVNVEDTHSYFTNGIISHNCIYLDEFAFVPTNIQEEFFASVYPTISSGTTTKVIITSTPNGMNMFYKIWSDSEQGKNLYERVAVEWYNVPGRDAAFREAYIKNTSLRQFQVEFECAFLGSTNTLIDSNKMAVIPIIAPIYSSGNVDVYKHPEEKHQYLISVDTSRGTGIDYSAFVVFDISKFPYEVVAKYRNNEISSMMYPTIIYNIGKHYNDAYVLVEINDVGQQVVDILLHDLEYENVLSTRSKGRAGQKIGEGEGGKFQLGVRTTTQVKRIGCANFKSLVENDKLIINDKDLLDEMFRFIEHNTKFEAEEGSHDDLVMCCVLFSWIVHQDYFKQLADSDARLEVMNHNASILEQQMLPFGYIDNHLDSFDFPHNESEADRAFNEWFYLSR